MRRACPHSRTSRVLRNRGIGSRPQRSGAGSALTSGRVGCRRRHDCLRLSSYEPDALALENDKGRKCSAGFVLAVGTVAVVHHKGALVSFRLDRRRAKASVPRRATLDAARGSACTKLRPSPRHAARSQTNSRLRLHPRCLFTLLSRRSSPNNLHSQFDLLEGAGPFNGRHRAVRDRNKSPASFL